MSLCYSEREWPGLEVKLEIEKMKKKKPSALFFSSFLFLFALGNEMMPIAFLSFLFQA
jgi:hypothetical protein